MAEKERFEISLSKDENNADAKFSHLVIYSVCDFVCDQFLCRSRCLRLFLFLLFQHHYDRRTDHAQREAADTVERQCAAEERRCVFCKCLLPQEKKKRKKTSIAKVPQLVLGTEIYQPSRIMKAFQYIFENNVIRIWNDAILTADFREEALLLEMKGAKKKKRQ